MHFPNVLIIQPHREVRYLFANFFYNLFIHYYIIQYGDPVSPFWISNTSHPQEHFLSENKNCIIIL